jgi:hypothetical protein
VLSECLFAYNKSDGNGSITRRGVSKIARESWGCKDNYSIIFV